MQMSLVIIIEDKERNTEIVIYTYLLSLILILVSEMVRKQVEVMLIVLDIDHKITTFSYAWKYLVLAYAWSESFSMKFDETKRIHLCLQMQRYFSPFFHSLILFAFRYQQTKYNVTLKDRSTVMSTTVRTFFFCLCFFRFVDFLTYAALRRKEQQTEQKTDRTMH